MGFTMGGRDGTGTAGAGRCRVSMELVNRVRAGSEQVAALGHSAGTEELTDSGPRSWCNIDHLGPRSCWGSPQVARGSWSV